MTLHYHGTPITPTTVLAALAGRHFCVSHAAPGDVARAHTIGQSVMLDNGAFSAWRRGFSPDWPAYYAWCDRWLDYPTTWAVIPDVIDAGAQLQDALLREWPHGHRGAPVWHMDEPIDRLVRLTEAWPRVCIGSTAEYRVVLSAPWRRRMDEAWGRLMQAHRRAPWIHMLRGMQLVRHAWPFASVDSTDVARNHNRGRGRVGGTLVADLAPQDPRECHALRMAAAWDAQQCPARWVAAPEQMEMSA